MNPHDASYRQLYSSPELVRDLFDGLIDDPLIHELDWQQLHPLPSDYISQELLQRQGDRVWRIPRRDGSPVYVILMLEHQARNDHYMAVRILTYCGLLYQSLLQHRLISRKVPLPRILPVVLYSGVRPWRAPTTLAELFGAPAEDPNSEMLAARYILVDEGSWLRYVLLPRALPGVALPEAESLLEIKNMLTDQSRNWTHQWKMEGLQEGRREGRKAGHKEGRDEGRKAGRLEGEATLLLRLLTRKFGTLPEILQQRIQTAMPAQLETWSLNMLDATTLDEVFTD